MMNNFWGCFGFLFYGLILTGLLFHGTSAQISSSEKRILFQLRQHLEYPDELKSWNQWTNPCFLPYSSSVSVVCSNGHVTEITVIGKKKSPSLSPKPLFVSGEFAVSDQTLSKKFSTDSLFTDLTKLTGLKKLSLVSLGIWGTLPSKISRFQSLEILNISSNFIYGEIPQKISSLQTLKSLVLADNLINGTLPDLSVIKGLQELDLSNNQIGPNFPSLGPNLLSILLRNNSLRSQIPTQMKNFANLQRLDVSSNHLIGPIPQFVLSLPSLWYLNLAENQLTGQLPKSTSCGKRLWFVDISSNLLVGSLPSCIGSSSSKFRKVLSAWNCLEGGSKFQHPLSFCQRQALAVIPPAKNKKSSEKEGINGLRIGITFGLIGGSVLLAGTVGMLICIICKRRTDAQGYKYEKSNAGKIAIRPSPVVDSKYAARSVRVPDNGLPSYHDFTLEELQEATNNFDPENLITQGASQGQVYKGLLPSGSAVLIKCINIKEKHSSKTFKQHLEVISQLRHQNLVSVLGHCVATHQDRHKCSTVYVVFEHVTNGSLREHLTDWRRKDRLKWPQRVTISMGIARGVHFLHTGVAPGVFGNDLKIEHVLLDETLTPKLGDYRIPLPYKGETPNGQNKAPSTTAEKEDIYSLGAIMLELLTGRQVTSETQLAELKQELEKGLSESPNALQQAVDLSMRGTFAYQSLKTAAEITLNCLSNDPSRRPPMEDVLWHLQYSIQAQQAWTTSGNLALNSGNLGLQK